MWWCKARTKAYLKAIMAYKEYIKVFHHISNITHHTSEVTLYTTLTLTRTYTYTQYTHTHTERERERERELQRDRETERERDRERDTHTHTHTHTHEDTTRSMMILLVKSPKLFRERSWWTWEQALGFCRSLQRKPVLSVCTPSKVAYIHTLHNTYQNHIKTLSASHITKPQN